MKQHDDTNHKIALNMHSWNDKLRSSLSRELSPVLGYIGTSLRGTDMKIGGIRRVMLGTDIYT